MREKLTVLIPCRNERSNIEHCVESVRGIADEILVADSGSIDGTLEIVRGMSDCRLIEREWVNYADFKNWAIPQASHRWILLLDADERATGELANEISQVLSDPDARIDAYAIGFNAYFLGHPLRYSPLSHATLRLFRRDSCRYIPRLVHERIGIDRRRTGKLRSRIAHYTIWSYDQYFDKYVRYTRWGAQEAWDRGKRASYFSLLVRPAARFLQLYVLRRGFLDGLPGLQVCALTAFFNTFIKQARLWEMEHAVAQPEIESKASPASDDGPPWPSAGTDSGVAKAVSVAEKAA